MDNARLQADRITYYQDYALADALGQVSISREGFRVVTQRMSYDATESTFSADILRTGIYPYYLSGATAGGSLDKAQVKGTTIYYGTPGPLTLNVSSSEVEYISGENQHVKMDGATFRIGKFPFFYLPAYTYYTGQAPYHVELSGGMDSELGAYLQTTTIFPVNSWLRLGANLDFYTDRGVLVGPTAQYVYDSESQSIKGALSTGFISDQGNTRTDIYNRDIDDSRGFAEWRHKHHVGERITLTSSISYWSDSEVTRDFREDYYSNNRRPDNFVEGVYAGDNYLLSAFSRFQPNNFNLTQQHLPEIRYDLLPVPVFNTGIYHRASASYAKVEEDFQDSLPISLQNSSYDRLDLTYRAERPIRLTEWMTFTPLAGARLTHYEDQKLDAALPALFSPAITNESFSREIFELGFDLEARAHASYPTVNRTWAINGLRHTVRPVLRYRYYSDPDALGKIAQIERSAFSLNRPLLDLSDLRNVDDINETHLTRVGIENLYQTRAEDYGSRTLAALNFYQDILFEKDEQLRYDGDTRETLHATWVELVLEPAPWLKFDLASRFKTQDLSLEELRTRTVLTSGEIWSIGLSTDMLNKKIDQYQLDFIYRMNERHSFFADARYDADTGQFNKTRIGLQSRLGNSWQLIYAVIFRNDAERESDFEFTVSLRLVEP